MELNTLVRREIRYRKSGFILGVLSIAVAAGCLAAALESLRAHDRRTGEILEARRVDAEARGKKLEDDYRKIMKDMGYNVLILPRDQDLAAFHAEGQATKFMEEAAADRLASSRIVTVNHILPQLQQKVVWEEAKPKLEQPILLIGTKGQVPIAHLGPQQPIEQPVPPGEIVVGHTIGTTLGLAAGSRVRFFGRDLGVSRVHELRGTKDDISVWIDLATAQEILGQKGRINSILALECNCPGDPDQRLALIRQEIQSILPDTQVLVLHSQALARVRARRTAAAAVEESLEAVRKERELLRAELEGFSLEAVPIVLAAAVIWIAFLAFANARDRAGEIGILRALGLRSRAIQAVLLGRWAIIGLAGGILGALAGALAGAWTGGESGGAAARALAIDPRTTSLLVLASPLIAMAAAWLPARSAIRSDPAEVLRGAG